MNALIYVVSIKPNNRKMRACVFSGVGKHQLSRLIIKLIKPILPRAIRFHRQRHAVDDLILFFTGSVDDLILDGD